MTFLAPLLLLAGALLAVPLVLHLFRRKSETVRTFPALRYLRESTREKARIVRLRQLLLLALRLAAVVLLVLAAARLVLPLGGGTHPPAGVVLVVDNGLASGQVVDDVRILDLLVDRAHQALDRLGDADRVWVLPAGEPWRAVFPSGRTEARAAIDALEPTAVRADLGAAMERARSLLEAGGPPLGQILVLSSLGATLLPEPGSAPPAGEVPMVLGIPEAALPPNRGLHEVTIAGGLSPRAGSPAEVLVGVQGESVADQPVRVWVDEQMAAAGRTDADGRVLISLPVLEEGWLEGRVELEHDALRADDEHHFALLIRRPPAVRAVETLPEHLATALAVLRERGRIGPPGTESGNADRQEVGLEAEGEHLPGRRPTLSFPPSDPSALPAANQRLRELGVAWRLQAAPPDESAGVLAAAVPQLRLPADLEVTSRYRILPADAEPEDPAGGRVLATLSDGSPWIVLGGENAEGDQNPVLLVGSPPDPAASRLPTSAAMVPFLAAAIELLDGGGGGSSIAAGAPYPLPPGAWSVTTPGGTRREVAGTSSFLATGDPGVYDVLDRNDELVTRFSVNPAPGPSPAEAPAADDAAARLGLRATAATGAGEWSSAILRERRGREVWRPLLVGVLLLLVAETWLAGGSADARRNRT